MRNPTPLAARTLLAALTASLIVGCGSSAPTAPSNGAVAVQLDLAPVSTYAEVTDDSYGTDSAYSVYAVAYDAADPNAPADTTGMSEVVVADESAAEATPPDSSAAGEPPPE